MAVCLTYQAGWCIRIFGKGCMPRKFSEDQTRKEMKAPPFVGGVDPQLEQAGWYLRDRSKAGGHAE